MERIAIIGTGKVGRQMARAFIAAGYDVVIGSRDPQGERGRLAATQVPEAEVLTIPEAAAAGDVVILAVPWRAVTSVITAAEEGLTGKVLIDATNPLRWDEDHAHHVAEPSGGEMVQELAPEARVVKAFNALGYEQIGDPMFGDIPADLLMASDDAGAKAIVGAIGERLGLRPLDAGPLRTAATLERMAMLWLALSTAGMGRDITFKVLER